MTTNATERTGRARGWWLVAGGLVLAVAMALWFRESGAIERVDAGTESDEGAASPLGTALASESAPGTDARARIDDARLAPTEWRFDELVFVRSSATNEPIAFDVQSYTSDGVRRAASGDDVVLGRDVEPGGVWILSAPAHCPAWVAPEGVVDMAALGAARPYFPLFPSATVVIRPNEGAVLPATIDWIELTPTGDPLVLANHSNGELSVSIDFAVVDEGAAQRELFAGVDDVARATQRVRTLREALQREINAESARHSQDRATRVSAMTVAHGRDPWANVVAYPPFGDRVVIEHVPAETLVSVRVGCAHMLAIETVGARGLRSRHVRSIAETEGFVLAQGEVLELDVRSVRSALVRVQQPAAATRAPRFELQRIADPHGASFAPEVFGESTAFEKSAPTRNADAAFEWSDLPAGTYTLAATWIESPDVHASAVHTFELAEGEEHDLGVLAPYPAGRVTIVPRLVGVGGAALPRGVDPSSLVVAAKLAPPLGSKLAARELDLVHGRAIVVAGLEAGPHQLLVRGVSVADHGNLIENAGGLSGEALIEALQRDLDTQRVALAPGFEPLVIAIDGSTRADVDVPIVRPVVCRVTIAAAPGGSANDRFTAVLVGDAGRVVLPLATPTRHTMEDGSTAASLEFDCPDGLWTLVVSDVPSTGSLRFVNGRRDDSNVHLRNRIVARIDIVGDGSDLDVHGAFEPTATLRIVSDAPRADLLTAPRPLDFQNLVIPLTVGHAIDGALEFTGLFANTTYVFTDGTIAHTGAPSSVVEVR